MLRRISTFDIHGTQVSHIVWSALCLWLISTQLAQAGVFSPDKLRGDPKVPWQISADTVSYDAGNTTYHARGNVVVEKQTTRLSADAVAFNREAMTATAVGHVIMSVGKDVVTGDALDFDLRQETGVIHNGGVFLAENHFYIRGDRIEKTGTQTYHAEDASLTSCDGDEPDWTIAARDIDVTIEGYGTAKHAVFRAADIPVMYTPYLLFPAKTKRQTGLLVPMPGYSSRQGGTWDQPFFWAIDDSSDATLHTRLMGQRGVKVGLEYRYKLTEDSFGTIMADGLKDRKVDDGSAEATEEWGYSDDKYTRPNSDRYWLRAKIDQALPGDATARLDLDIVSDQDYLTEFRDGSSGFTATNDYFLDVFDRDLDTSDDNTRTNQLNVNKTWTAYALNFDVLWYDNVVKRRWSDTDDTLQRLPRFTLASMKQSVLDSGLYWDVESEATCFYREDGDRGYRADLYPRVYYPMRWKNYLSVEPSAGWRQTVWRMDSWEDEEIDQNTSRGIYDFKLDVSTELSKIMSTPFKGVDRIRHSIKPRVTYTFIPDRDQSDLPYFTSKDRIEAANLITYSLTNTFTARLDQSKPKQPSETPNPFPSELTGHPEDRERTEEAEAMLYDYTRFCRIYLDQSYDVTAARNNEDEVLTDLYGELDFNLNRFLLLSADASYDTYDSRFSSHNVGATLTDRGRNKLSLKHRYTTSTNESIRADLSVGMTDALLLSGFYERDLLDDENIERGGGFVYKAQCWTFGLFYVKEDNDEKYNFLINLDGIGGFGN